MNKSEIIPLLSKLGVVPSRKLGQNFLVDSNCLDAMVRTAAPQAGETILEVGPGTGVLTERLLSAGAHVIAVELDHRLAGYLRERFAGNENLELIEADACRVDYSSLAPLAGGYRCIANLPYSCGSVFLGKICSGPVPPKELFVLLQKEMGERLAAAPGTKEYGSLTAKLAVRYQVSLERIVPPGVFFPPPEIASAFVKLASRPDAASVSSDMMKLLDTIVTTAFSQRRKKAIRLLEHQFASSDVAGAFQKLGLEEGIRAEDITPAQFLELASLISVES